MHIERRRISAETTLSVSQAQFFAKIAERQSGIQIATDQVDFLSLRVRRRMRIHGDQTFERYIFRVNEDKKEEIALMECLVTHTTAFFREPAHFRWLRNGGLSQLTNEAPSYPLKVWSAASSAGPELWSVGMEVVQYQLDAGVSYSGKLYGTDISQNILERARNGVFEQNDIESIPPEYQKQFLQRSKPSNSPNNASKRFRIAAPILESATFLPHNLLHIPPRELPEIDLALLRNVLIYFSKRDQQTVFNNVVTKLRIGGVLMIGHTESHSVDTTGFSRLAPAIYRKDA